ncbi:alpha/beta fold hydrolase [Nonomuraea sp. ZG12]|uniref:alpha/beta fold hydrolase n=1 Tax=Nonomuraea sp. ZG12 TaxID=3452207 RepID=UPI003F8BDCB4
MSGDQMISGAGAAAARRGLTERDGHTWMRPGPDVTGALRELPEFADALPVFREVTGPFLIVTATCDLPAPPELAGLMAAFRAGLVAARPNIEIHELDAGHGMLAERPEAVARLITRLA